ncbi:8115_t:CDS:1, partial [Gigaspora margarita]
QSRNQVNNATRENIGHQNSIWPNVQFLEFTKEVTSNRKEYLMVELLEGVDSHIDDTEHNNTEHIRNLKKRKKNKLAYQISAKKTRQQKSLGHKSNVPKM